MLLALATRSSLSFKTPFLWRLTPRTVRLIWTTWTVRPFLPLYRGITNPLFRAELRTFSNKPTVDTDNRLLIRDSYVNRFHQVVTDPGEFIRLSVEGGGCSGFQYEFSIDTELKEDDVSLEREGARLVVDSISLDLLKGASVEYHEELIRSSFRVVDIPNAESGCSCGASFALKV